MVPVIKDGTGRGTADHVHLEYREIFIDRLKVRDAGDILALAEERGGVPHNDDRNQEDRDDRDHDEKFDQGEAATECISHQF